MLLCYLDVLIVIYLITICDHTNYDLDPLIYISSCRVSELLQEMCLR